MDSLSILQTQIAGQLAAINASIARGWLSANAQALLVSNASTLQGLMDKLVNTGSLSAPDQQTLQQSLESSQAATLAAQAHQDGMILLVLLGAGVAGIGIFLLVRYHRLKHP